MMKSRMTKWAEHVEKRNACRILVGKPKEEKHQDVEGG
jgi:hypothetical protein